MLTLIIILAVGWLSARGLRRYQARHLVPQPTISSTANHNGKKFFNDLPSDEMSLRGFIRMTAKYFDSKQPDKRPAKPLPVIPITDQFDGPPSNDLRFAWLGHSSLILEIEGQRLLLDPILSERSSFVQWAGPKRFHPAPISAKNLPEVEAVLISHDHMDHLDKATIETIADRDLQFIVPLGVGQRLRDWDVAGDKITEVNWWAETDLNGLKIVSTPARHFSGRGLLDRDLTLWSSWSIIGENRRIFYSGDTGPTPDMNIIGEKYGPFDFTFIEVGAYDETWGSIHAGPGGAVEIHKQVKGQRLVPIHWGTFDLALHSWYTPAEELFTVAANENIRLMTPQIGEIVNPDKYQTSAWWQQYMRDPIYSPETTE